MRGPTKSIVVDSIARVLIPCIFTFGFYVLFFGHESPGGGFQGGAIIASGIILSRMTLPLKDSFSIMSDKKAFSVATIGVFIYLSVGVITFFQTGNYFDYSMLTAILEKPLNHYWGIMAVEIGVTLCVVGTMVLIFDVLAEDYT